MRLQLSPVGIADEESLEIPATFGAAHREPVSFEPQHGSDEDRLDYDCWLLPPEPPGRLERAVHSVSGLGGVTLLLGSVVALVWYAAV